MGIGAICQFFDSNFASNTRLKIGLHFDWVLESLFRVQQLSIAADILIKSFIDFMGPKLPAPF